VKKLAPAILSLIIIILFIVFLFVSTRNNQPEIERTDVYVASASLTVPIYREEDALLYKYKDIPRGSTVTSRNLEVDVNDGDFIFTEIELDGETDEKGNPIVYYISSKNITETPSDVVRETVKYVRTPVTVYENSDDARISSFLKKGTELSVCGYVGLKPDGSVEMYKIDNPGSEGYVYSKYLTDTPEDAAAPYSQILSIHEGREYSFELYGGSTESLDWYPYEKPQLSTGPILQEAKAMYLNAEAAGPAYIDDYIELAVRSGANSIVIDIKDGSLAFPADIAAQVSPTSYDYCNYSTEQFASSVQKIKDAGLYAIGRIVVFRDEFYAMDNPDDCIVSDVASSLWPSVYSRDCWYYNVALAQECVEKFGFNEIQFDYVRFPEEAYGMSDSGTTDFKNVYDEEKVEAVQNFCFYAADQLHKAGAYVSIDVFGECVYGYVTAYGQYWPAISNIVDAVSGMPYTDHFDPEPDYWYYPYTTVYEWASLAAVRQTEIRTPAIARTWITGYDTPNWDPVVTYGPEELISQAQALYDSGLTGGFIPWNGASSYSKYAEYADVWGQTY